MANAQLQAVVHSLRHLCTEGERGVQADGELLAAFLARRDQAAFAALVRRHGPMVLGVCRRVLRRPEDAEDCFQATFLLLARQAVSVRKRESLGSWLHGVAHRMATNSRRAAARRRAREARATAPPAPNPAWQAAWREVQVVLDEEIQRLPAAYRQAFVLCCLEGKGCAEAARELGQKEGTVWSRVARARGLLRARLARRGVSLALVLAAGALSDNTLRAAVPAGLSRATAQAAAGHAPPSASVAALVEGGIKGMFWSKAKGMATALLIAGALVVGAGVLARPQGAVVPAESPAEKAPPAPKGAGEGDNKELTDRHGDALPPGALARMGTVRFRPGDSVGRLAFSRDGKLLASGNWRMSVRLWEAASGKEVRRIPGPHYLIAFAEGGKVVVTRRGRDEYNLHLWDVATGKELRTIPIAEFRQYTELSPDGKVLVTAAYKGTAVYVHDPANGAETHKIEAKGVVGLALSPDGRIVAALEQDNLEKKDTAVRLWDTATGKELCKIEAPFAVQDGDIAPLVFSPHGKTLAGAPADKVIHLWDVATGKDLRSLKGHGGDHGGHVQALAFSPDGKVLASGGMDRTVRLWEVTTGKELHRMTGHKSWVPTLAFAPDGRTVASAAQDNSIRRWDVATGKEIAPLGGHEYWIFSAALSPDGKTLATGAGDGTIRLWKADTGEELRKIDTGHGWVNSVAFSPDGKSLISGGWDRTVRLWDAATGKELRKLEGHGAEVIAVAFSPDGKLLASAPKVSFRDGKRLPPNEQDSAVRLWDAATGKELARLEGHDDGATCVTFSHDGKRLATGDQLGRIRVWDVATRKELLRIAAGLSRAVAFSPDGRFLAVGQNVSHPGTVEQLGEALQLWDTATGKVVRQFHREPRVEKRRDTIAIGGGKPIVVSESPGPRRVNAVAFAADGRSLVSAEKDGSVVVWEVLTGQLRREFTGHQGEIAGLAVSADGRKAASAGMDLTALVWDVTGRLQQKRPPARISAERLGELWAALNGTDAPKAAQAAATLAARPEQAVEFLSKKLAAPEVDAARVGRLIADLDSESFDTRDAAERELERLGRAAEPALRKALKGSPSPEQRRRIEKLVGALDTATASPEVAASRAVEVLEWVGTPEAKRLVDELARGAPESWLTKEAAAARKRLRRESGSRP
jgi:RNA polymerase sigma factor (sigma-70 family)